MPGVINPDDYDPGWPGDMNYEDWIMLVADVDAYTPKVIDHIIILQQRLMRAKDAGAKPKRNASPKLDLDALNVKIGLKKPTPKLKIRRMTNG